MKLSECRIEPGWMGEHEEEHAGGNEVSGAAGWLYMIRQEPGRQIWI